ncbi:MAG TPA: CoA-binding protein [bacterium]|nr:CoA-binding protein [bacterium]
MANQSDPQAEQWVKEAATVAVVGMQDEAHSDRAAFRIPQMLQERGLKLYPVNPKIQSSLGEKALPDLKSLPVKVDILDVFRRSEAVPELVEEILALPEDRRPRGVWLQSGITHPDAEARLEAAGLKVVSDACLGVFAARVRPRA